MTNTEKIIAILCEHPGLDDDALAARMGVQPRQQVNQICRRLEQQGRIRREIGPAGKVVNVIRESSLRCDRTVNPPPLASALKGPEPNNASIEPGALTAADPYRTLFIIPCSGAKMQSPGTASGPAIADSLPPSLATRLRDARKAVAPAAQLDETSLMPAWSRYRGHFYKGCGDTLAAAVSGERHIVILSGGYGVVLASEPIGYYNRALKLSDWPRGLLDDVLLAYCRKHGLKAVRAFASSSTGYSELLRRVSWSDAGVADAWLLSPNRVRGALAKAPRAGGEAFAALMNSQLIPSWRSIDGLHLEATRLRR